MRITRNITPKITQKPVPILTRHSLMPFIPPEYHDIPVSAFCLADKAASVSVYSYLTVIAFFDIASSKARAMLSSCTFLCSCIRRIRFFIMNVPPTSIAVSMIRSFRSLLPVSSSMIYLGSSMVINGSSDNKIMFAPIHNGYDTFTLRAKR